MPTTNIYIYILNSNVYAHLKSLSFFTRNAFWEQVAKHSGIALHSLGLEPVMH